ncbi:hypothetical protein A7985_06605 [Pseudoalteromonas luteoviolacea]|uniref:Cyclic nucleotide-binding domain-containing protein n=1 Tax=Pseudoalteromonas luteoviolacea TaxID=43657 RepID=A0A1C0TWC0_9GAMM|nr:Crp/Fnr family transcriptional regulator [Pseudoalteromonas luteoviolacea]MBQ4810135.1 Crp/Fnr family transcriptional regulator [Pseudoalteromonas luteoviolacea]OCQ23609.1 hypothetical protein A7985_06605 [Pseudoalteromonas luteoviolacea]
MDEAENRHLLQSILTRLVPFNKQELDSGLNCFKFNHFAPKAHIFRCQDIVSDVHFLISGIGRYYYIDAQGKEFNKSLVKQGGAFTSIGSLIENQPSPFYTQTLSVCTTASIPYKQLLELARSNLNWSEYVRKLYEQLALKKEKREAGLLLLSGQQRYEQFLEEFGEQSELFTLNQVAMYLGITDVSLSRIRNKMGLT